MDEIQATALQEALAQQVEIPAPGAGYTPGAGDVVLALDIQYDGELAHVAGDLTRLGGERLGTFAGTAATGAPYVPSLFCFREGPPLLALMERLAAEALPAPDVVVVDGHGVAHPRRFGAACWLGVVSGAVTVGAAKNTLLRFEGQPGRARGGASPVWLGGEEVGRVLRTQDGVKPIYVSAGHRVGLDAATRLLLMLPGEYRIPDPQRRADQAARELARGERSQEWTWLGELPRPKIPPEKDLASP